MAPHSTVHLIRHAEGYNQIPGDHPERIRDALLTDTGVKQGKDFCDQFPYHDRIDLLAASPLRRTIQTAQLAFEPEIERGLRILTIPEAMEALAEPSDTGIPASELKAAFEGEPVDFSLLTEDWYVKKGVNAPDDEAWRERARRLRLFLRQRPEQNIVLITHGFFAHYIIGHIDADGAQTGEYWQNMWWRTYEFDAEDSHYAHLVETAESLERHPSESSEDSDT